MQDTRTDPSTQTYTAITAGTRGYQAYCRLCGWAAFGTNSHGHAAELVKSHRQATGH